ncbi:MAG: hypothetical protein ABS79_01240 [Planctomycetes bacterium SCN 63-9]|nr:MAG: hypothetical protein ABS79_01240 [Planctomycetes bacterium SCN 63-9]
MVYKAAWRDELAPDVEGPFDRCVDAAQSATGVLLRVPSGMPVMVQMQDALCSALMGMDYWRKEE